MTDSTKCAHCGVPLDDAPSYMCSHNDKVYCDICIDDVNLMFVYMADGMSRYSASIKAGLTDPSH